MRSLRKTRIKVVSTLRLWIDRLKQRKALGVLYIICTLLFLIDPSLSLRRLFEVRAFGEVFWVAFSMAFVGWLFAMAVLTLLEFSVRRHGGAFLLSVLLGVTAFQLIASLLSPRFPAYFQLASFFTGGPCSFEDLLGYYGLLLTLLAEWIVCLAVLLLVARWFCKKFPPSAQ